jgi:hypothetical protein
MIHLSGVKRIETLLADSLRVPGVTIAGTAFIGISDLLRKLMADCRLLETKMGTALSGVSDTLDFPSTGIPLVDRKYPLSRDDSRKIEVIHFVDFVQNTSEDAF